MTGIEVVAGPRRSRQATAVALTAAVVGGGVGQLVAVAPPADAIVIDQCTLTPWSVQPAGGGRANAAATIQQCNDPYSYANVGVQFEYLAWPNWYAFDAGLSPVDYSGNNFTWGFSVYCSGYTLTWRNLASAYITWHPAYASGSTYSATSQFKC